MIIDLSGFRKKTFTTASWLFPLLLAFTAFCKAEAEELPCKTLTASGNFEANSADAVYYATKAGLGISHLSTYMVASDLRDGTLLQLFPEHNGEASGIYAVYASKHHLAPKVRVFIDYFSRKFGDVMQ